MSKITNASATAGASEHRLRLEPVPEDGARRPLWSVMIPTYHCARYLRQTLESVLSQDPGPERMQIEVIDDCSTKDDPEAVVREVGAGRVLFHRQAQNVGHTGNFETCLQRSRGQLVHLLHGDDAVMLGFYGKMSPPFAENPKLGAAFCRNLTMDADGNWLEVAHLQQPRRGVLPDFLDRLAVQQRIQTPAMVVRRAVYESLGGFDRRLSWTEDWEMWVRIAMNYPVWYEPEPLALYRMHDTSNSGRYHRTGETARDLKRFFKIIEDNLPTDRAKQLCEKGRENYARYGLGIARGLLRKREITAAISQVRESAALCPNLNVLAETASLVIWAGWRACVHAIKGSLRKNRAP
jgi:glycosyltransferase involved in cell wall biosynthesis